ncbi:winged helix-turn-helix transcriptional regulator [Cryptosporangium sp. NPDC051539]|uniref:winged helix-turn-helix transcriptional regulator n=1 Tax=Cryptosporangium sp. NPDC051539 TaxID=3363962 RepID=UPI00378A5201
MAAGVVERRPDEREVQYVLTPAGQELAPIVQALGAWGVRWVGVLGDSDLDPKLLLWDWHRNVDLTTVPAGRTVVGFRFPTAPKKQQDWWLVLTPAEADVCDVDPGYDVAVQVTADLRRPVEVWRGDLTWSDAMRAGDVALTGPTDLRRAVPAWFRPGPFATVPRT